MEMRDWELLASPDQFSEGAKYWFIDFYKDRGLSEQKLHDIFNVSGFSFDKFEKSIRSYIELYPDDDSRLFASDFWDNSQDAIDEYFRVRSHFLFKTHSAMFNSINWLTSWGNCFRFSSQDLSREEKVLFYRRYWLDIYRERHEEKRGWRSLLGLRFEIVIPSRLGLGAVLTVGGEDQFQLGIWLWKLGSCWLAITQLLPGNWLPSTERETGIQLFEDHLSLRIWWDDCGWDTKSRGFYRSMFLLDFLFGGTKYMRSPGTRKNIEIYLPEATYQGTAEGFLATWTRPRAWWWKQQVHRVELKFPQGIPIPGKGENDYDIDEDAIYGSTMVANSIEDAAQIFVQDVLETRRRYGGSQWLPERRVQA
jgi:hypothetical protein